MTPMPWPPSVGNTSRVSAHASVYLLTLLLFMEDIRVEVYHGANSHLELLFLSFYKLCALILDDLHVFVIWISKSLM